jgi:hypothetical protein
MAKRNKGASIICIFFLAMVLCVFLTHDPNSKTWMTSRYSGWVSSSWRHTNPTLWPRICFVCGNHNPVSFSFMIYHRCVTRVTRLVAHVEQELLTVPEYIEVIRVLELGSCVSMNATSHISLLLIRRWCKWYLQVMMFYN